MAVGASGLAVAALSSAVAAVAVFRHLGTKPLWRDEAISVSVARRPIVRILSVLPHHDANAGVYYLLLHAWLKLGDSVAWGRAFSAVSLMATSAVVAFAATRWRGWEAGLAAGLLIAFNPFLVYYGQDTRPYALAVFLAALSTVALFRHGDESPSWAYVVVTVALIYVDLFAILYVAALAGAVVAGSLRRGPAVAIGLRRSWWLIAWLSAPMAAVMLLFERGQISWLARPSFGVLTRTLSSMSSGWLGLEVLSVLALLALASAGSDGTIVTALASAFVLPPLALWTLSQISPTFIDRYVICSTLALVGLATVGLTTLRSRAGRTPAVVVLVALLLLGGQQIARSEAQPFKVDDAPAVVTFIRTQMQAGDAVAYAGGGLQILIESARNKLDPFPPDIALAPGGEAFFQHDLYPRQVSAPVLASRLAAVQRLWMVTDPSDQQYPQGGPFAALRPLVMATFTHDRGTPFGSVAVTLYVRSTLATLVTP